MISFPKRKTLINELNLTITASEVGKIKVLRI